MAGAAPMSADGRVRATLSASQPKEVPVTRRVMTIVVLVTMTLGIGASAAWADEVGFGSLSPSSGPPGTEISYSVVGGATADTDCRGSSAFTTEFLDGAGVRLGTGADTIGVPDTATAGAAFVRLVCYVSDATARRVIHGVCASFQVTAAGTAPGAPSTAAAGATVNAACPPTPRLAVSQAVIRAQTHLGETFNKVLIHTTS